MYIYVLYLLIVAWFPIISSAFPSQRLLSSFGDLAVRQGHSAAGPAGRLGPGDGGHAPVVTMGPGDAETSLKWDVDGDVNGMGMKL